MKSRAGCCITFKVNVGLNLWLTWSNLRDVTAQKRDFLEAVADQTFLFHHHEISPVAFVLCSNQLILNMQNVVCWQRGWYLHGLTFFGTLAFINTTNITRTRTHTHTGQGASYRKRTKCRHSLSHLQAAL